MESQLPLCATTWKTRDLLTPSSFLLSEAPPVRMEITYASSSHRYLPTMSASSSSSLGSSMPNRPVKTIPLQHPNTTSSSSTPLPQAMFWRWTAKIKRTTPSQWIDTFLPCYRWIRTYKWREYLQPDLMAGLTVGIMLVPQVILSPLWRTKTVT